MPCNCSEPGPLPMMPMFTLHCVCSMSDRADLSLALLITRGLNRFLPAEPTLATSCQDSTEGRGESGDTNISWTHEHEQRLKTPAFACEVCRGTCSESTGAPGSFAGRWYSSESPSTRKFEVKRLSPRKSERPRMARIQLVRLCSVQV